MSSKLSRGASVSNIKNVRKYNLSILHLGNLVTHEHQFNVLFSRQYSHISLYRLFSYSIPLRETVTFTRAVLQNKAT